MAENKKTNPGSGELSESDAATISGGIGDGSVRIESVVEAENPICVKDPVRDPIR